jgi:translation initiation factor 3 subunit F
MDTYLDLPDLNEGLSVRRLQCIVHPNVVPSILDHYVRRPEEQKIVIGTLMGTVEANTVQISTSFSVPLTIEIKNGSPEVYFDSVYQSRMFNFYKRVNPKESLVGMYITTTNFDLAAISCLNFYIEMF